jgi:hypothetical protein
MFETEEEAMEYLMLNGCMCDKGVIYPPQSNCDAFNRNKFAWVAVNLLLQEYNYTFQRYKL